MAETNELRWSRFQECTCYDVGAQQLCSRVGEPSTVSFEYALLSQCWPYLRYLLGQCLYFILGGLFCFGFFFIWLIIRMACNVCGGRRPSIGWLLSSRRQPFPGYSLRSMSLFKIVVGAMVILAFGCCIVVETRNERLRNSLKDVTASIRLFADESINAMTAAGPWLTAIKPYAESSLIGEIQRIMSLVSSYMQRVDGVADLIDEINGQDGHHMGRTQIVSIFIWVPLTFAILGTVLGVMGTTARGIIPMLLAVVMAFLALAPIAVSMAHTMVFYTLTDTCEYLRHVSHDGIETLNSGCSSHVDNGISYLLGKAHTEVIRHLCDHQYATLCHNDFNCAGYDICSLPLDTVSWANVSTMLQDAHLVVNGTVNPLVSLPLCLLEPTCFGHPAAHHAANATVMLTGTVAYAMAKLREDLKPYAACRISLGVLHSVINGVCDIAVEGKVMSWWSAGLYATIVGISVAFVLGSKRFRHRNLVTRVAVRRALRRSAKAQAVALGSEEPDDEDALNYSQSDTTADDLEDSLLPEGEVLAEDDERLPYQPVIGSIGDPFKVDRGSRRKAEEEERKHTPPPRPSGVRTRHADEAWEFDSPMR